MLPPFVCEHIERALNAGHVRREWFRRGIASRIARGELPADGVLEPAFWVWWEQARALGVVSHSYELRGQYEVTWDFDQCYRLDFRVQPDREAMNDATQANVRVPHLAVELDGHEYHERTPTQVIERDRRDRRLAELGWAVMHFSFTEFNSSPLDKVIEVVQRAHSLFGPQSAFAYRLLMEKHHVRP